MYFSFSKAFKLLQVKIPKTLQNALATAALKPIEMGHLDCSMVTFYLMLLKFVFIFYLYALNTPK